MWHFYEPQSTTHGPPVVLMNRAPRLPVCLDAFCTCHVTIRSFGMSPPAQQFLHPPLLVDVQLWLEGQCSPNLSLSGPLCWLASPSLQLTGPLGFRLSFCDSPLLWLLSSCMQFSTYPALPYAVYITGLTVSQMF